MIIKEFEDNIINLQFQYIFIFEGINTQIPNLKPYSRQVSFNL